MRNQDIVQLPHQHIGHFEGEDLKTAIERNFKEVAHMLYILQMYEKKTGKPINEKVEDVTDENGNLRSSKLNEKMVGLQSELQLADEAVTAAKLAVAAVVAEKIQDGAVVADKIAANAVTAVKILAGAITAEKIAAGAITADKLNVNELSAITAYLGVVTGGEIYSSHFSTRAPGETKAFAELLTNGDLRIYDKLAQLGLVISGGSGQGTIGWYHDGIEYADAKINPITGAKDLLLETKAPGSGYRFDTYDGSKLEINRGGDGFLNVEGVSDVTVRLNSPSSDYMRVYGNFTTVAGTKYATEQTKSYGMRRLAAEEGPDVRYTIKGCGELKSGVCYVWLDQVFLECIEPHTEKTRWMFQLTPMFKHLDLCISEFDSSSFVVREKNGLSGQFCWEMSAIRKGFAGKWLQRPPYDGDEEEMLDEGWEDEILLGVDDIEKGI